MFKEQVINIIASVINLYWDLVSFNEAVKVQQQAVDLNNKLLSDNRKQVEIGTLAPISIVSAEAELATAAAGADPGADPRPAAGDDSQERAQPEWRREPLARRCAHHSYRPYPGSRDRGGIPHPGYGGRSASVTSRCGTVEDPAFERQDQPARLEERTAAQPRRHGRASATTLWSARSAPCRLPSDTPFRAVSPYFIGGYGTAFGQLFRHNFPNYTAAVSAEPSAAEPVRSG